MFRRLEPQRATLSLMVDGRAVLAAPGDTVAGALLAAGIVLTRRSPVSGAARGVYCGMGVCFECLVTIDGVGNRQACLVPVAAGMVIETGSARRDLTAEPRHG